MARVTRAECFLRIPWTLDERVHGAGGREKINLLPPHLDEMVTGGLVALETVELVQYCAGEKSDAGRDGAAG
jgi:hypothetical protein